MSYAAPNSSKYLPSGPAPSSPTSNYNKIQQQHHTSASTATSAVSSPSRGGPNKSSHSHSHSNARIDPAQMPRPDKGQHGLVYHTRSSATTRKTPPTSNSIYSVVDNGNCSPRVMRCTMVAPPGNKEVLTQVGLPFAALCTPFAAPEHSELPVPDVDDCLQEEGGGGGEQLLPPRCTRCAAYVNLNVQWIEGGNSWVCNICDMKNSTPQW